MRDLRNLKTDIGKNIKALRESKDWSQKDLGYQADTKTPYICEVEAGKKNPTIEKLHEIATAFGVDVKVLF